jgi:hypothetical protein
MTDRPTSKMRDSDMPLAQRIDAAIRRITNGGGLMRVPVEATDPDIVLSDCLKALDYYRAGLESRAPKWVPCRVLLDGPARGEYPVGHTTLAEAGEHDCESNRYGAVIVRATNGKMLGLKPAEFEPLEWRKNHD